MKVRFKLFGKWYSGWKKAPEANNPNTRDKTRLLLTVILCLKFIFPYIVYYTKLHMHLQLQKDLIFPQSSAVFV